MTLFELEQERWERDRTKLTVITAVIVILAPAFLVPAIFTRVRADRHGPRLMADVHSGGCAGMGIPVTGSDRRTV